MMSNKKEYIGDSVYADFNGFEVILTTENGLGPSNTIIMEPVVLKHFLQYIQRVLPTPNETKR